MLELERAVSGRFSLLPAPRSSNSRSALCSRSIVFCHAHSTLYSAPAISLQWGPVDPKFQVEGFAPTNHSSSQKTRLNDLSYGIKIWTDLSSVLSQFRRLTDRQTDRRTESSSLDRVCIPCSAVKRNNTSVYRHTFKCSRYIAPIEKQSPSTIGPDFDMAMVATAPGEKTPHRAPPCEELDPATIFFFVPLWTPTNYL